MTEIDAGSRNNRQSRHPGFSLADIVLSRYYNNLNFL
jgi:hypothetical protein